MTCKRRRRPKGCHGMRDKTNSKLMRMMLYGDSCLGIRTEQAVIKEWNRRSIRGKPKPPISHVADRWNSPDSAMSFLSLEPIPDRPAARFGIDLPYGRYVVDMNTWLVHEVLLGAGPLLCKWT